MKRDHLCWALYDLANSALFIVFIFYFPQWLVIDRGNPSWWFNATLVVSSVLFIASAPFITARIDAFGKKIQGLRIWTALTVVIFSLIASITLFAPNLDILAAALFALGMYSYLVGVLFYTPILNDISDISNRGRVSGIGQALNFTGQVGALVLTLPFVSGTISLFGGSVRAETLFPSIILMAIFVLPLLLLYKDRVPQLEKSVLKVESTVSILRNLLLNKPLALFLLAYFFFSDALLTFSGNFSLYLEKLYATPDTTKALLTIGILGLSVVGSIVSGFVADRFGYKKVMTVLLVLWFILFTAAALAPTFALAATFFLMGGLLFGPVWTVSRAIVGQLAPAEATASSYGYYVIAERFATFIGPLTWTGVLLIAGDTGPGYRWALFSMGLLILIGIFVMRKVSYSK